jgi:2,4-dienoyl-CoA reductase-like NADH-dependent reductase (Old Yellow Enzyme family)
MEVSLFQSEEEFSQIIIFLDKEPLDAISVSTYDYSKGAFGVDKRMAQIAKGSTSLPIMICGKIFDRSSAEDALQDADIILSAKSMLLNPNWVEDVKSGKKLPLYSSEQANAAYTKKPLP